MELTGLISHMFCIPYVRAIFIGLYISHQFTHRNTHGNVKLFVDGHMDLHVQWKNIVINEWPSKHYDDYNGVFDFNSQLWSGVR